MYAGRVACWFLVSHATRPIKVSKKNATDRRTDARPFHYASARRGQRNHLQSMTMQLHQQDGLKFTGSAIAGCTADLSSSYRTAKLTKKPMSISANVHNYVRNTRHPLLNISLQHATQAQLHSTWTKQCFIITIGTLCQDGELTNVFWT